VFLNKIKKSYAVNRWHGLMSICAKNKQTEHYELVWIEDSYFLCPARLPL